jgi:hypothetical protein
MPSPPTSLRLLGTRFLVILTFLIGTLSNDALGLLSRNPTSAPSCLIRRTDFRQLDIRNGVQVLALGFEWLHFLWPSQGMAALPGDGVRDVLASAQQRGSMEVGR